MISHLQLRDSLDRISAKLTRLKALVHAKQHQDLQSLRPAAQPLVLANKSLILLLKFLLILSLTYTLLVQNFVVLISFVRVYFYQRFLSGVDSLALIIMTYIILLLEILAALLYLSAEKCNSTLLPHLLKFYNLFLIINPLTSHAKMQFYSFIISPLLFGKFNIKARKLGELNKKVISRTVSTGLSAILKLTYVLLFNLIYIGVWIIPQKPQPSRYISFNFVFWMVLIIVHSFQTTLQLGLLFKISGIRSTVLQQKLITIINALLICLFGMIIAMRLFQHYQIHQGFTPFNVFAVTCYDPQSKTCGWFQNFLYIINLVSGYLSGSFILSLKTVINKGYLSQIIMNITMLLVGMTLNFLLLGSFIAIVFKHFQDRLKDLDSQAIFYSDLLRFKLDPCSRRVQIKSYKQDQILHSKDILIQLQKACLSQQNYVLSGKPARQWLLKRKIKLIKESKVLDWFNEQLLNQQKLVQFNLFHDKLNRYSAKRYLIQIAMDCAFISLVDNTALDIYHNQFSLTVKGNLFYVQTGCVRVRKINKADIVVNAGQWFDPDPYVFHQYQNASIIQCQKLLSDQPQKANLLILNMNKLREYFTRNKKENFIINTVLIENLEDLDIRPKQLYTQFYLNRAHLAVLFNQHQIIERILRCQKNLIYSEDVNGNTALHIAALNNNFVATKLIIQNINTVKIPYNSIGLSPLEFGCVGGSVGLIRYLLKKRSWISQTLRNCKGIAIKLGRASLISELQKTMKINQAKVIRMSLQRVKKEREQADINVMIQFGQFTSC